MKIKVENLTSPLEVTINGDEDWLVNVYASFPGPLPSPRLKGHLAVNLENSGCVSVTGSLSYEPFVSCSRCADSIPWPVKCTISAIYKEPPQELVKERSLRREELDERFFKDGCIDIEELINEEVHLAIPSQTVRKSSDGKTCMICHDDTSSCLSYKSRGDVANPFAALKDLKLN